MSTPNPATVSRRRRRSHTPWQKFFELAQAPKKFRPGTQLSPGQIARSFWPGPKRRPTKGFVIELAERRILPGVRFLKNWYFSEFEVWQVIQRHPKQPAKPFEQFRVLLKGGSK